jgi:hypothetical protein
MAYDSAISKSSGTVLRFSSAMFTDVEAAPDGAAGAAGGGRASKLFAGATRGKGRLQKGL